MRSQLVSDAVTMISNRYLLASVAAQATRALHRPHSRMEETLNDVFRLVHRTPSVVELGVRPVHPAQVKQPGGLRRAG
jgi:hypothetical protein